MKHRPHSLGIRQGTQRGEPMQPKYTACHRAYARLRLIRACCDRESGDQLMRPSRRPPRPCTRRHSHRLTLPLLPPSGGVRGGATLMGRRSDHPHPWGPACRDRQISVQVANCCLAAFFRPRPPPLHPFRGDLSHANRREGAMTAAAVPGTNYQSGRSTIRFDAAEMPAA